MLLSRLANCVDNMQASSKHVGKLAHIQQHRVVRLQGRSVLKLKCEGVSVDVSVESEFHTGTLISQCECAAANCTIAIFCSTVKQQAGCHEQPLAATSVQFVLHVACQN